MMTTCRILRNAAAIALTCAALSLACAPAIRSSVNNRVSAELLEQLWVDPGDPGRRDLFWGPGGPAMAPDPDGTYRFLEKDTKGFSPGYDVVGPRGLEWSVKLGPEAQTEVVASRLIWAAGFHQPPTYYLARWKLSGGGESGWKGPARFRPKAAWLHTDDEWSWHRNPFVGTRPYRGLLVLMLMINNADLRTPNNKIYELAFARERADFWYVVRDLGASFGATGFVYGTRNDIDGFESQGFVSAVRCDGRVIFDYAGRHRELFDPLTVEDVRWAAERMDALERPQWDAAFRAAGYAADVRSRYISKLRQKIAQGLALETLADRAR